MADLPQLSRAAQELLGHLGFDPCDLDTLAARTGTDTAALLALLAELEIAGRVAVLPGGRYQRLS
jgi:DNA processing protein